MEDVLISEEQQTKMNEPIAVALSEERRSRGGLSRRESSYARSADLKVVPRQIHIRTALKCFLTVKAIEGEARFYLNSVEIDSARFPLCFVWYN